MDGDYVEDSEGEGGLDFSPSGYGQPVALDASFPSLQVHPGPKSYSPSTISEFPSTLQATGMQSFDSPIVEFTATTHSSTAKKLPFKKRPKSSAVEIIDLSDDEDEIVIHRSRKPLRKRAASLSESSGDERTPSTVKPRRKPKPHGDDLEVSTTTDKPKKPKKHLPREIAEDNLFPIEDSGDEIPARKVSKGRKSAAKEQVANQEPGLETPKILPKKRKSPDAELPHAEKPSKKRKKKSPLPEDDNDMTIAENRAEDVQEGVAHTLESGSDDELRWTKDTPAEKKKFVSPGSKPTRISGSTPQEEPSATTQVEDPHVSSPQTHRNKSKSPIPLRKPSATTAPPRPPPVNAAARQSTESRPNHGIPKRGSVSNLLRKTGLHARLSSSKLTRKAGDRIAPLHPTRTTPPPPPPPIPKPKPKVAKEEEEEEDFTGMTEKQIARYLEEKKKRAWYSP